MSLFSSDMRVANTAAPSFQSQANVSQYGWTGADQGHYNQLIQYVDECRKIWLGLEEKILYIEEILVSVESIDAQVKYVEQMTQAVLEAKDQTFEYAVKVQDLYNHTLPLYENFVISYADFNVKYTDFLAKYPDVIEAAANALTSETNAAKSAKDAADIAEELRKGQVYRGTWNLEGNASYPPKPDTNSVWDVTLNEGSIEYRFDGKLWYWGDRLLYLKDDNAYTQIEAGGSVTSVNGKKGAVTITAADVKAAPEGFGLGDVKMTALGATSCNDAVGTGWYGINSATTETPTGTGPSGGVLQTMKWGGGVVMQVFYNFTSDRTYTRRLNGGTWSAWVELYSTFNKPSPDAIGALNKAGDTMTGNFGLNTNSLTGANNSVIMRDYNNGNVTLSGGLKSDGTAGDLYIGHTAAVSGTAGANTRNVQLRAPMIWGATNTSIVDTDGINSEFFKGPIRTEKDAGGVYHTVVGGTDSVNRGRTIVAGGECGKHIADNINTGAEQVHIGGDDANGVFFHTGLQSGYNGASHYRYWMNGGDLYSKKMDGAVQYKYYHQGFKPTAADVGALSLTGGTVTGPINFGTGGTVSSPNKDVMEMKGAQYSFVTGVRGAHLCGNSYWDGTNWKKYDASKPSMHVAVEESGEFKLHSSAATSTSPLQLKPLTIDITGNATFNGEVKSKRTLIANDAYAGVELLIPGKHASMMFTDAAGGNMRFVQTNGAGVELTPYANFHPTALTFYKQSNFASNISADGAITSRSGLRCDAVSPVMELHSPGVAAYAWYIQGNGTMTLGQTNGAGAVAKNIITIDTTGNMVLPSSTLYYDGSLTGTIWGGPLSAWCRANFAPISDRDLKRNIKPATKSALEDVSKIDFVSYDWDETSPLTKDKKSPKIGLTAQQMEEIDECYSRDINTFNEDGSVKDSTKALDVTNMLALALKANQELLARIEALEAKLN